MAIARAVRVDVTDWSSLERGPANTADGRDALGIC
jgi:hypothetical protein